MSRAKEIMGQTSSPTHLSSNTPRNPQKNCKHRTHHCIVCRKPFGRTCRKDKHMIECAIHGNLSKRGAECEECVLERACREREEKEAGTTTKNKVEEEKHRKWLEGSNSERKPRWPQEKKDKAAIHLVDAQPDAVQGNIIQSMATPGLEILEEE